MAGSITGLASKAALHYLTGRSADLVVPQTMRLALLTAAPPPDPTVGQLNEVVSTGYFRQPVTFGAAVNTAGQPSAIENSGTVLFGPFTAATGLEYPTTHCALLGQSKPVGAGNLLPPSASGFETGVADWGPWVNCSLAQDAAQFRTGAASMAQTATAVGEAHSGTNEYFGVTSFTTYEAVGWIYSPTVNTLAKIDLVFYGAGQEQVLYLSVPNITVPANTWTRIAIQGEAPTTALTARPVLRFEAAAAGQSVYWDDVSLTPTQETSVLMTWLFDQQGQAAQNESLQISAGDLSMSLG